MRATCNARCARQERAARWRNRVGVADSFIVAGSDGIAVRLAEELIALGEEAPGRVGLGWAKESLGSTKRRVGPGYHPSFAARAWSCSILYRPERTGLDKGFEFPWAWGPPIDMKMG